MKWIKLFEQYVVTDTSFINDQYVQDTIENQEDYLLSEYEMEHTDFSYEDDNNPDDNPNEGVDINSEEFKEWVRNYLQKRFNDIKFRLESNFKRGTINIWRCMIVKQSWLNDLVNGNVSLGVCWAFNESSAIDYLSDNDDEGIKIIIQSKVDTNKIDWTETIICNMDLLLGDAESEIRLKKDVNLSILNIKVDNKNMDLSKIKNKVFRS